MKKLISALSVILLAVLLAGCMSSGEKASVRSTVASYFAYLSAGEYASANAMCVQVSDDIKAEIDDCDVNDYIFKDISYEIWSMKKDSDSGLVYVDTVIEQMSLVKAYGETIKEYSEYLAKCEAESKEFTDRGLENEWNAIFLKHVKTTDERVSMRCTVIVSPASGHIYMTADFRNCLFGGELDAINAINEQNITDGHGG